MHGRFDLDQNTSSGLSALKTGSVVLGVPTLENVVQIGLSAYDRRYVAKRGELEVTVAPGLVTLARAEAETPLELEIINDDTNIADRQRVIGGALTALVLTRSETGLWYAHAPKDEELTVLSPSGLFAFILKTTGRAQKRRAQ